MRKLYFLLCMFFTAPLFAQEINITEQHHPDTVAVAQPFSLQYDFSFTPDYRVILDEKSVPAEFALQKQVFTPLSPGTGRYEITAQAFTLGRSTFTVTFNLQQKDKTFARAQDEFVLDVKKVSVFKDDKFREIRSPFIPAGWLKWLLILLIIAGIIAVLYLWRQRIKDSRRLKLAHVEDKRPCEVIAKSKIEALLQSGLWEQKEYKLFYITLSDILREYLWRRFSLDVSADTTVELLRHAKSVPQLETLLLPLRDFLNSGDLVKFARFQPEESVRNKDVQILQDIIRLTTPLPVSNDQKTEEPL